MGEEKRRGNQGMGAHVMSHFRCLCMTAVHYYQDSDFWQREYRKKCSEYQLCEQRLQLMTDRCKVLEEEIGTFRGKTYMGKERTKSASANHSLDIKDCKPEHEIANQSRSISPSDRTTCTPRDSAVFDTHYEYHALHEANHSSHPNLALLHPCHQREPFARTIPFKGATVTVHQSTKHPFSFDPPANISAQMSREQESAWRGPSAEGCTHPYAHH